MLKIVIDASIVIDWFTSEGNVQSEEILRQIKKDKIEVFAPSFILVEVLNILLKKKGIPENITSKVLDELRKIGINFKSFLITDTPSLKEVCYKYNITSYDGLYIYLAKQQKCKLLTADKELLKVKNLTIGLNNFVF